MDRRGRTQEPHPLVSDFACPTCGGMAVRLATVAEQFFYLRCDACAHVWSHPERRHIDLRGALPTTSEPLKAELRPARDRRRA
jgi:predicted RNA-binding Zn-ribbon protein involved in translation (DUF1610 family)